MTLFCARSRSSERRSLRVARPPVSSLSPVPLLSCAALDTRTARALAAFTAVVALCAAFSAAPNAKPAAAAIATTVAATGASAPTPRHVLDDSPGLRLARTRPGDHGVALVTADRAGE